MLFSQSVSSASMSSAWDIGSLSDKLSTLPNPIHARLGSDDSRFVAHIEEAHDCFAALWTIVERSFVYVHADEAICGLGVQIAGKLHGIGQSFFAVLECVLNAVAQSGVDRGNQRGAKRAADGVSTERQR